MHTHSTPGVTRLWAELPRRAAAAALALLATFATSAEGAEERFPSRPVKMIVPSAAAGSSDLVGRVLALQLAELWKQPVVIENRGAVNGVVGAELGQKAAPDGYTLTVGNSGTHVMNYGLYKALPYDPLRGFAPIAKVAVAPGVLLASAQYPIQSVRELVAFADSHPTFIATPGATAQFAALMFNSLARVNATVVPYKGNSPADLAVAQGEAHASITTMASARAHVQSGKARVLATMGRARSPLLPEVPTVHESGVQNFELEYWVGLFAPAGTPSPIVEKISVDVQSVLRMPETRKRLEDAGFSPDYLASAEFERFVQDSAKTTAVSMRKLGIEAQ